MGQSGKVIDAFWAAGASLVTMNCPVCGLDYALTQDFYGLMKMGAGREWSCPNGHSLHFPETETAAQKELRAAQHRAERAEADATQQREARQWAESRAKGANIAAGIAKAAKNRLLHRVACGVCPHCQRTFQQLARHMKTKHGQ